MISYCGSNKSFKTNPIFPSYHFSNQSTDSIGGQLSLSVGLENDSEWGLKTVSFNSDVSVQVLQITLYQQLIYRNVTLLLLNTTCPVLAKSVDPTDLDLHCLSLNM